jgi:hypothetical protein
VTNNRNEVGILQQIRRNAVALISLSLAVISLGYNTWRNETTEHQRNTRHAAFRVLEELGELQQLVDHTVYEGVRTKGDYITGWGKVILVRDLGGVIAGEASPSAEGLFEVWHARVNDLLLQDTTAGEEISEAVDKTRMAVLSELKRLE